MPAAVRALDSSAVLALIQGERGSDNVLELLPGGFISAVNAGETIGILRRKGVPHRDAERAFLRLGLPIEPFTADDALALGALSTVKAERLGLALGDRACLAAAMVRGASAVTGDRKWKDLDCGVPLEFFR